MATILIRTGKTWQKDFIIVWQVHIAHCHDYGIPNKSYLMIDFTPGQSKIYFTTEKPVNLSAQSAFVNLLRKHLPTGKLANIIDDRIGKAFWLIVTSSLGKWFLRLELKSPPELCFISPEKNSFIRMSAKGTFTKQKVFDEPLPELNPPQCQSILNRLLDEMVNREIADDHKKEELEGTQTLHFSHEQRTLLKKLKRRRKTIMKYLDKIQQATPSLADIAALSEQAEFLKTFAHLIQDEMFELVLSPEQTGKKQQLTIELDPEVGTGANIEQYFIKLKKQTKAYDVGIKQIKATGKELQELDHTINDLLTNQLDDNKLALIAQHYGITAKDLTLKRSAPQKLPYKQYQGSQDFVILVGKSAKDNDELTKRAKSNDFWLHAAGVTGSHTVVQNPNKAIKILPDEVLKQAAILALHFSDARHNLGGEVYLTQRQYLKKKKGMAPGKWQVLSSEIINIKYSDDQLQKILKTISKPSS